MSIRLTYKEQNIFQTRNQLIFALMKLSLLVIKKKGLYIWSKSLNLFVFSFLPCCFSDILSMLCNVFPH